MDKIFFELDIEIDDSELEPTAEELQKLMTSTQKSLEESTVLKTKEMREREKETNLKKFTTVRLYNSKIYENVEVYMIFFIFRNDRLGFEFNFRILLFLRPSSSQMKRSRI